jgi:hypothetical protein
MPAFDYNRAAGFEVKKPPPDYFYLSSSQIGRACFAA